MSDQPTIYDIAKHAKVGIATVSRALNGTSRVAQATRDAVRKAVDDLGYRPNRAARRLAVRGVNRPRVAALMPFFSANFYYAVSRPLAHGLAAADMDLVLFDVDTREDKQRVLDRIAEERSCEGLVLCSMGIGAERQEQFAHIGVPVVSVDYPLPGVPSVTVDNRAGGSLATRLLIERGSRDLGMLTGPAAAAFRLREDAFADIAGAAAPVVRAEALTRDAGRAAVADLLDGHPRIDGIVCVNDVLAVGALEELRARARAVPADVQVIGYDDQPLMDVLGLSTVRQPIPAFGEWAARSISALLADPRAAIPSLVLSLSLIERATTRPPARSAPVRTARGRHA